MHMQHLLPPESHWSAVGMTNWQFKTVAQAVLLGGSCRVGLEDTIYIDESVLAPSNIALVEKAVSIIRALGRRRRFRTGSAPDPRHWGSNAAFERCRRQTTMTLEHTVALKWARSTSDDAIEQILADIASMKGRIKAIRRLSVGQNRAKKTSGFTHAFTAEFDDQDGLDAYDAHSFHQLISAKLRPLLDDGFVVDLEITPS